MNSLLSFLIALLIGSTVIVNGVSLNAEDIIGETQRIVDETNIHQIRTALEIYYINHNHYPNVFNKDDMLTELLSNHYLYKISDNLINFSYSVDNQGESYDLDY